MSVIILKNTPDEGPGTIEDFLISRGIRYKMVNLSTESCPNPKGFDTLILMGGPMSANDINRYPYLNTEIRFLKEFINDDKKVLGICLGSQLIAKVLGAKVYKGSVPEIGWYNIEITSEGKKDPVFSRLIPNNSSSIKVFQWHEETFDLPNKAVKLASSDLYPVQAFRYRDTIYSFQFHIEVTDDMIYEWMKDKQIDMKLLKESTKRVSPMYLKYAMEFYDSFFL